MCDACVIQVSCAKTLVFACFGRINVYQCNFHVTTSTSHKIYSHAVCDKLMFIAAMFCTTSLR